MNKQGDKKTGISRRVKAAVAAILLSGISIFSFVARKDENPEPTVSSVTSSDCSIPDYNSDMYMVNNFKAFYIKEYLKQHPDMSEEDFVGLEIVESIPQNFLYETYDGQLVTHGSENTPEIERIISEYGNYSKVNDVKVIIQVLIEREGKKIPLESCVKSKNGKGYTTVISGMSENLKELLKNKHGNEDNILVTYGELLECCINGNSCQYFKLINNNNKYDKLKEIFEKAHPGINIGDNGKLYKIPECEGGKDEY